VAREIDSDRGSVTTLPAPPPLAIDFPCHLHSPVSPTGRVQLLLHPKPNKGTDHEHSNPLPDCFAGLVRLGEAGLFLPAPWELECVKIKSIVLLIDESRSLVDQEKPRDPLYPYQRGCDSPLGPF
jgi:hypothetical protein